MGTLTADRDAFRDAVAGLHDAAARLTSCRDRAARSVDGLLGSWRGPASSAYAAGWDEWSGGAAQVLDGLATMATLLDAVSADYVATDSSSGDSLSRLTARLG
ncbi:WXG100 family type VII secretion target [Nocardioides pyridinolyticus]